MTISARRLAIAATLAVSSLLPVASAQALARLAPADAVFVLDVEAPPQVGTELFAELAALDWAGAAETLRTLAELMGDELPADFEGGFLDDLGALGSFDALRAELRSECPAVPSDLDLASFLEEGILTVALSTGIPFPVVTMVGRVDEAQSAAAAQLGAALIDCFGSDELVQDGTPIHILGQGSDLPLVFARIDDVWIAATSPDAVRGVIRRAGGSDEPGLADTRLWAATERFEGSGLGLALDLAAGADAAQALLGFRPRTDTLEGYVQQRLLAAARTLGGVALRLGITPQGVMLESAVAVDPAGGDEALAELLLCSTCRVSRPFLAPSGSNGVRSQHVPVRGIVAYVEGWLDGAARITGQELDLRTLVQENLSADLDFALLDWLGTQVNVVTLEPFTPTAGQLLYGQPLAITVPVAEREAAELGLDTLATALEPFVAELFAAIGTSADGGADSAGLAPLRGGADLYTSRQLSYRGVTYDRLQLGPTIDIAVAFVGSHLVVATPSGAIRPIVDTFLGDRASLDDAIFRRVREVAPDAATLIAYENVGANLAGIAALGHTIAQPVAAALSLAAAEAAAERGTHGAGALSATDTQAGGPHAVGSALAESGVTETAVFSYRDLPIVTSDGLTADGTNSFGEHSDRYRLTGVPAGEHIRVALGSEAFDTYLYLLDAEGNVLDENDDFGSGTDSALALTSDGRDYVIEVSSFGGDATGSYTLVIEQGSAEDLPQVPLQGVVPQDLDVPGTVDAELTAADGLPAGEIGRYYALGGLGEGELVDVSLVSNAFDTYLRVIDPETGVILAENDDNPDTTRSAVSFGATGEPVWVQVTSWSGSSTGPYTLEVTAVAPAAVDRPEGSSAGGGAVEPARAGFEGDLGAPAEAVEPPSFASLLELAELLPNALAVLSEHVGLSVAYAYVDDATIYRRSLLEIAW